MKITGRDDFERVFQEEDEATLIIDGEYFIAASPRALELLDISSIKVIQALHPAKISPEAQPDGELSKLKANELFTRLDKEGYIQFPWQHINIHGQPFNVEVSLLKEHTEGKIKVHWRPC